MRRAFRRAEVLPGFWLFAGLVLLWLPFSQAACLAGTAILHEAGHLLASRLCKSEFRGIRLGFFGWEMDLGRERLSYRRQILVDLAGPCANALCAGAALLFIRAHPTETRLFFFFCNALYGAVQLLPVPTLDGGRALTALLSLFLTRDKAEGIARGAGFAAGGAALAAGLFLFWKTGNPSGALFLPGANLSAGKRTKKAGKTKSSSRPFSEKITWLR